MDAMIAAAARALAGGDALAALKRVALRNDPPALALRGIALAQLDDLVSAQDLLRRAARAFGSTDAAARARCVVAQAEIALVSRDLDRSTLSLDAARATLEAHGDRRNATHARYIEIRRLLLIGRLGAAERLLDALDPADLPPALQAVHALVVAGIAMRRVRAKIARTALVRAAHAARTAGIAALTAEVEAASASLQAPAARLVVNGETRPLRLADVEALFESRAFVIDGCRYQARAGHTVVHLATRPVLFTLLRALGEAWPDDVARGALVARAFRAKHADESQRARLRVEIGRLRKALGALANVDATANGFALTPRARRNVVVLAPPVDDKHAAVLALLCDGEAWSSSALALALGASQRQVQRALDALATAGKVQSFGRGRARRWLTQTLPAFATALLLPAPLPTG